MLAPLRYDHVDVFTSQPYSGNSLAVFQEATGLKATQMAAITRELRHFESIFLEATADAFMYDARVFDLAGELDFAGHPVIGAACALHSRMKDKESCRWTLRLNARTVTVDTTAHGPSRYSAMLNQGAAQFIGTPPETSEIASWFALDETQLDSELPPEVVSTGLKYLIVPVRKNTLERARIVCNELEEKLASLGAQFAYLLDAGEMEGRHWNNDGLLEDVATGSAAGCVAAYLRKRNRIGNGEPTTLKQGRFVGRPSEIVLRAHGDDTDIHRVEVGGDVALVGYGWLNAIPG